MRLSSLILMSCFALTPLTALADWKSDVETNINSGNFNSAITILKELPSEIKQNREFEIDSLNAMMQRIRNDFRITREDGIKALKKKYPSATITQIDNWIKNKQIETLIIDGKEYWFKKGVNNLALLDKSFKDDPRKAISLKQGKKRLEYSKAALSYAPDENGVRFFNTVTVHFTLTVNPDEIPAGETIKAWLPFPIETVRQRNIKLISSSSTPTFSVDSPHNTIYMEQTAVAGKKTVFEAEYSYEVAAQYIDQETILKNIKPYDTTTADYKKYTATQLPHVVVNSEMKALANSIIGNEKNPVKQASLIFDWISDNYPWAGARDYSTLTNMPKYVITEGHGDCGQVALLYITLNRAIGIPARWESGWMIHPNEIGYHDWAETYFEGVGWLPTDVSFGRTPLKDLRTYYKTGTDLYRFATNYDINSPLYPQKKYLRSETIDFQAGEVEWKGGNLNIYKQWDSELKVLKVEKKTTK